MLRPFFLLLAANLLLTGSPTSAAAQKADFTRRADQLLYRDYFFHPWREAEQTVEGDDWLVNPPLLHYVALELGKNARNAPDAWCYLRESHVPDRANNRWKDAVAVKNFERWVYQRDVDGARTVATEKVPVPEQMFEYHKEHLYDQTARRTSVDDGQNAIQFALDEAFLSGGPHRVAVKITYLDRENARWDLKYFTSADDVAARTVQCGNSGEAKTVTLLLDDAFFPGRGTHGRDLAIRAVRGDAVIRFLRVVKRTPAEPLD